jgi:hypothetical protein
LLLSLVVYYLKQERKDANTTVTSLLHVSQSVASKNKTGIVEYQVEIKLIYTFTNP